MALKPTVDPKWSTDNDPLDNVEPDSIYKEKGISSGSTWTRQWLNWMFFAISQWIDWVRSYAMDRDQNLNDVADKPTARTNLGLNDPNITLGANTQTANKWKTARTLSLTGHITGSVSIDGSANASLSTTLANSGVTAGTYPKVTVDVKGRVTSGAALSASDVPSLDASKITTGELGTSRIPNLDANKITSGTINAARIPTLNQSTTGNAATATKLATARTISMTGDVSWTSASFDGSANVTGSATLSNSGVTAGTYPKVTVDAKGRVTAGSSLSASDIPNLDASKVNSGTVGSARLPLATPTNRGTITMRLDGTTLYIRNDGNSA